MTLKKFNWKKMTPIKQKIKQKKNKKAQLIFMKKMEKNKIQILSVNF